MRQAKRSNIVCHKPNYAILFCLLVGVGDLGLQIVSIRVKALLSDNYPGKSKPEQSTVPNNNRQNWVTFEDDNPRDSVDKDLQTWEDFGEFNFDLDNEDFNAFQIVHKDNESLIRDPDSEDEHDTNDGQLLESNQIPKEHQLPNKSEQISQDDQILKEKKPETNKQLFEENQVFELSTMLCQQKKIIQNCYKIYNEGSSSGLTEEKQQELKKLVEDAEKIQVDFNEKVNKFELPEPVEKFREKINSNLDQIKGKLLDKTDLSAEYDQLEPAEMTVPIEYLERSKFWKFFSNHKKALIYGSIGVGVVGAVAGVISGIYYHNNKKLSGHIPEWKVDVNWQWLTKPNNSFFATKLVVILLLAIILAVVAFFVLQTASKNSSVNKRQQPPQPPPQLQLLTQPSQLQPNQPTQTPTDTNNANTPTTTGTENVDKTWAATGPTTPTTTTATSNKTNKSKQSARKSTIKSDKKSARKSKLTKSNKTRGEKSKAKSTIQPAKSKGSGIGE